MRKLILASAILVLFVIPFSASAQTKKVGVGIILGQPTGLSAKFWMNQKSAIDVAAAWQFLPAGTVYVQADYLYQIYHVFPVKKGSLPLYIGVGASATVQANPTIGLRVPIGIEYLFPDAPFDAFLEIGIGMSVYPATRVQPNGGVGLRYTF